MLNDLGLISFCFKMLMEKYLDVEYSTPEVESLYPVIERF